MRFVRILLSLVVIALLITLGVLMLKKSAPSLCTRCTVIVISAEALGIEDTSIVDPALSTTPQLAALAHQGVVFENAYSSAPWSVPAQAALLTGYYPWSLGVWDGVDRIPAHTTTLASRLQAAGYRTALFSNGFAAPAFGFGQGFDEVHGSLTSTDDGALLAAAEDWLQQKHAGGPSFLFVHTAAVGFPYGETVPLDANSLVSMHARPGGPTEKDAARYRAAYKEEVAKLDDAIGSFVAALDAKGLLSDAVVVVTAGNGERLAPLAELGLHAASLSDESLRVPLIVLVPHEAPRAIAATVETRSLATTLLDVVGIDSADARMGASLLPFIKGSDAGDRVVLAASAKDDASVLHGLSATADALAGIENGTMPPTVRSTPYQGSYSATALKGPLKVVQDARGQTRTVKAQYDRTETTNVHESLQPPERALEAELLLRLITLRP